MLDVRCSYSRNSNYLVSKTFEFCASHVLPNHPGKCRRLHGHNYKVIVRFGGFVLTADNAFLLDYADINTAVKPIIDKLDHQHLGYGTAYMDLDAKDEHPAVLGPNFYPSAENLAAWIGDRVMAANVNFRSALHSVDVAETSNTLAVWHNRAFKDCIQHRGACSPSGNS